MPTTNDQVTNISEHTGRTAPHVPLIFSYDDTVHDGLLDQDQTNQRTLMSR